MARGRCSSQLVSHPVTCAIPACRPACLHTCLPACLTAGLCPPGSRTLLCLPSKAALLAFGHAAASTEAAQEPAQEGRSMDKRGQGRSSAEGRPQQAVQGAGSSCHGCLPKYRCCLVRMQRLVLHLCSYPYASIRLSSCSQLDVRSCQHLSVLCCSCEYCELLLCGSRFDVWAQDDFQQGELGACGWGPLKDESCGGIADHVRYVRQRTAHELRRMQGAARLSDRWKGGVLWMERDTCHVVMRDTCMSDGKGLSWAGGTCTPCMWEVGHSLDLHGSPTCTTCKQPSSPASLACAAAGRRIGRSASQPSTQPWRPRAWHGCRTWSTRCQLRGCSLCTCVAFVAGLRL